MYKALFWFHQLGDPSPTNYAIRDYMDHLALLAEDLSRGVSPNSHGRSPKHTVPLTAAEAALSDRTQS